MLCNDDSHRPPNQTAFANKSRKPLHNREYPSTHQCLRYGRSGRIICPIFEIRISCSTETSKSQLHHKCSSKITRYSTRYCSCSSSTLCQSAHENDQDSIGGSTWGTVTVGLGGGWYPTVGLSDASDVGKDSGVGGREVKVDADAGGRGLRWAWARNLSCTR